ncbi:MAG TPA: DNA polymerase III subunit alpha [Candidatus Paceibacterota bacterium]|nr:DNA polymerase III subunit alpha [Candidatus Paceibacterota bacterium]
MQREHSPDTAAVPAAAPEFIHLHTHSHYSLLDGLTKVEPMVKRAKELGMSAIGLTDHGAMYGAIDFYGACMKHGVKPIIGVETYVANRTRLDKEPGIDNKRYHLTLLAKNNEGYRNLIRLVTAAHVEGYYYKPRVDKDLLRAYSDGLIALSGCPAGELGRAIQSGNMEKAEEVIREYQEIFGKENYFIEVMHHPDVEGFWEWRNALVALAKKLAIPLVATQDSHYLMKDDAQAHKTLVAIGTASDVTDMGIFGGDGHYHFISTAEALEWFADIPEAVANTKMIADRCQIDITLGKFIFPEFPLPEGKTSDDVLRELCLSGIPRRGLEGRADVLERLDYELGIVKMKGYAAYFLVVEDLIRFAHENGIYTNIRGSVAGSMTTYLLGMTKIDPLEYRIPFERFLNPERPSAPDIDMDFADDRREEVLEYAKRKYGADKVAQIGTFGTMMARGAVRDVARALGKPYELGDRIARMIPMGSQGFPMTIEHAMELEPDLAKSYKTEPEVREILDIARKLEGTVRHVSVHAAGVVIAPKPLLDYVPVQFDPKGGKLITQYDMYTVGEDGIGLTKLDFLGIRNLTILANAIRLVEELRGITIDIERIPLNDKKVYAMLARGETTGLFQLNGAGMTKWLVELRPTTIHDINAMVALYRPGPMQFIPEYIARKKDPSIISYLDPALEPILKQTHGILVYQDDLLIMAHELAGYSWGEVDKFRKAVGKKIPEEMAKQKEKFITGTIEHSNWSRKKAEEIWAWIEPFAAYGFNKAHSASYGRVAYQTAYLKANFPAEYMAAVLSAEAGDTEKVSEVIAECKHMAIQVLPPDLNASFADFTVVKGATDKDDMIRFGLYTIKNLGEAAADAIITERKRGGPFRTYAEFLERVTHKDLNKKSLEALIKSGAFDTLGEERGALLGNIDMAIEYHRAHAKMEADAQDSLFSGFADPSALPSFRLRPAAEASTKERLSWEKELLGLYVSGHPLEEHRAKMEKAGVSIKDLTETSRDGAPAIVAGIIEKHRVVLTKKNEHMAFITLADFTGSIEVVLFPRTLEECKDFVLPDRCVAIKGRFSFRNESPSVVAEKVKAL